MKNLIYWAFLVFGVNLMIGAAQGNRTIKPIRTWTGGGVDDKQLEMLNDNAASGSPAGEAVFNKTDWVNLWTAWRGDEAPKIDFTKNLIVFCTTKTPNHCSIELKLSPAGDLKIKRLTTLIYSRADTFDYKIVLVRRAGIKTINGKSIAPGKKNK